MNMHTYECLVRITAPNNFQSIQPVRVAAIDPFSARIQLQALYGKDSLLSVPIQVR